MLYASRFYTCILFLCAGMVVACGGGNSPTGTSSKPAPSTTSVETVYPVDLTATPQGRMQLAMSTADASILKTDDASFLISSAMNSLESVKVDRDKLLNDFYAGQSSQFELVRESYMMQPSFAAVDKVFPLVIGDKGNTLASISTLYDNRIAAYGYDILAGYDPTNTAQTVSVRPSQTAHKTVFKRVLAWLVTGNPLTDWSSRSANILNVAWSSLPTSSAVLYTNSKGVKVYRPYASAGLTALGIPFNSLSCDPLSDPLKDCAAKAQLVVVGAIDRRMGVDLNTQLQRIQEIVKAQIPILYLNAHPDGGAPNDYARAAFKEDHLRHKAMGFAYGDNPDKRNYYVQDAVSGNVTFAERRQQFDYMGNLVSRLSKASFSVYDWSNCVDNNCVMPPQFVKDIHEPVNYLMTKIQEMDVNGLSIFDAEFSNNISLQQLILWADTYRRTIVYPLDKVKNSEKFQLAYVADSLVAYVRKKGAAQTSLGNYLDDKVQTLKGSPNFEAVDATLPGAAGFTAMGRFALPGQAVEIKWSNAPPAGIFKFKINTTREGTNRKWEPTTDARGVEQPTSGLRRPMYLRSPEFLLGKDSVTVVSPYGGLLMLVFQNAKDTAVSLQIKGAAKHPFYDATQGSPDATVFLDDLKKNPIGWFEIKTPGLEIHSITSKVLTYLEPSPPETYEQRAKYPNAVKPYYHRDKGIDMYKYLAEAKKYVMEEAYQLAGFRERGLELKPSVQKICDQLQWDCVNTTIHAPPIVQHYQTDIRANCGSMCSGQPIDSSSAFDPRHWGESHEMGHNLQRFKVYDGMSTEVSNNIFPMHKRWQLFRDLGRTEIGYSNELVETQTVFDMLAGVTADKSLSASAKSLKIKQGLWSNPAYAAQNRLRLYFYLQWVLIYFDALKEKNPTVSEYVLWEQAWDVFTLMYLNLRQIESVSDADWLSVKDKLGFGSYTQKPATSHVSVVVNGVVSYPHHDYLLVMLSKLTGRDQRPLFDMWGVETYAQGRHQVQIMNLPAQALEFHAVVCSDDFRTRRVIDMSAPNPSLPAEWGPAPFKDQATNWAACQAATATYESSR
ncbi:MAG: hypothetical protein EBW49_03125 [Betaproteobacteria bacterium]|nr:hypothetical protein [Betaproteobacteria bacterium]